MKKRTEEQHREPDLPINAIPVPVLVGSDNNIRAANSAAGRSFGFAPDHLTGKPPQDLVVEEDRAHFNSSLEQVITGIVPQASFNARFIRAYGAVIPYSVSISPHAVPGEKPGFIIILADSGTEQVKLAGLRESEEHFRNLAESTPIAILLYQDDKWVFANTAAERITGYSNAELNRMNFWDIVHPDFVQIGKERGRKRQAGQQAVSNYEIKIITKSGEEKWVMINGTTTHYGGKTAGLINVIEITEIKRIQEELESTNRKLHAINEELIASRKDLELSEYRYRDIFDNFPVGIFQTKPEGDFITANNEMARILGYARASDLTAEGETITNCYADPGTRTRLLEEIRIRGSIKGYETRFRRKNGEFIWVSINSSLRRSADESGEYLEGYIQDITAQKQAEEEKAKLEKQLIHAQKLEAIGRLAGGIAHDFNNILTAIMGNAEIALKTMGEESIIGENLDDILVTSKRAADLTRQLLAFSRKQVIKPVVIDLNSFLAGLERMLCRIIGEDYTLEIRTNPASPRVKADPSQMEQLIVNLVVNARDAMPGGGMISIASSEEVVADGLTVTHERIMPGPYIRIDVTDSGTGMDKETLENIFEPFYSTKGELGTGLGLSTVYGIVRQNDGFITVASEKGKGSVFSCFLPECVDMPEAEKPDAGHAADQTPVSSGETILIVEDEERVRKLLVRNLSDEGYRVLEASNSLEAIELYSRGDLKVDLILSDVVLPDIAGPVLIEKLRMIRAGFRAVFISGYLDQNIISSGVLMIPKPFLPSELKKKIREVLSA